MNDLLPSTLILARLFGPYSQTDLRDLDGVDRHRGINEVQLGWRILPPMENSRATSPRSARGDSEERQYTTAAGSLKRWD